MAKLQTLRRNRKFYKAEDALMCGLAKVVIPSYYILGSFWSGILGMLCEHIHSVILHCSTLYLYHENLQTMLCG